MNKKVIISAALTGSIVPNDNCTARPVTPEQIAADAVKVVKAGAAVVHLHARNEDLTDTLSVQKFKEIVDAVNAAFDKENLDAIINISTSSGTSGCTEEERIEPIKELRPEMCSYDAGSMNWACGGVFMNSPRFLHMLNKACEEYKVKPEMEIFDGGMMTNIEYYINKGELKAPIHYQFILGVLGGLEGTPENVAFLKNRIPEGSTWSISGIGKCHMDMMLAGLAYGADGLRVGLEDNIYYAHGEKATNEQLVKRCADLCRLVGREPATATEAREILGIKR
ncbi:MAG: 3-keto-5-aminohexanoate cleavage protein [Anaerovoracaceae bacterium]